MCKCKIQNQLSEWIDRECHLELLYKISVHGGTADKFHELCDDKGPTVTIFYNTDNNVYGGYTSLSWKSEGSWCTDKLSFLFKLYTNKIWEPRKFTLSKTNTDMNVLFDSRYGPKFENLKSFNTSVDKTSGYYSLSKGGLFGGSYYDMGGENAQSVANGHNNVTDLEVYLVKDGPEESITVPWRDPPGWKSQTLMELKDYVIDYRPPEEMEAPEANVLLVGQIGAGKSSLLNTMNSIFKGEMTSRAWTGSSENSLTTSFNKFRIRDPSTRKFLNFRLCDTRGLEENMCMKNEDMALILDGHIPHNYTFNPVAQASNDVPGFHKQPTSKDKIHVIVFVVDGSTVDVMPEGVLKKKIKDIKCMAIDRGIPLLVYITKIDKVWPLVDKDVTEVFFSRPVEEMVNKVADVIAIPRAHILPVKNYENEGCLKTKINILALKALKMALFADDFLENQSELQLLQQTKRLNVKD
ncbi:interferon-induced protein 44-like [Ostrea edulis]|uniref:interferon-induced protein 44-like n=1 Tax=Ostrea edulis TaxID=37623 RepID=UPI0024AF2FAB|nr:interferon-induced protein 44-like [Ostrea edulis]